MNLIYKTKVETHSKIKDSILNDINSYKKNSFIDDLQNISHCDWNLGKELPRNYFSIFLNAIQPYLANMTTNLQCDDYKISNFWFQQYEKGDFHGWHTHPGKHFANVYFLESTKNQTTKFKHFSIECEEGDLISFPAFLPHCSDKILEGRKTIISFNTDFFIGERND